MEIPSDELSLRENCEAGEMVEGHGFPPLWIKLYKEMLQKFQEDPVESDPELKLLLRQMPRLQ